MEIMTAFNADMATYSPAWVGVWVNVLLAVLALSIPFSFVRMEARVILVATILGVIGTMLAYSHFGYTRILGIGHIVAWTPTVIYLLARRSHWNWRDTWSGKWIALAVAVMVISLAFDYTDAVRWLFGERGVG